MSIENITGLIVSFAVLVFCFAFVVYIGFAVRKAIKSYHDVIYLKNVIDELQQFYYKYQPLMKDYDIGSIDYTFDEIYKILLSLENALKKFN